MVLHLFFADAQKADSRILFAKSDAVPANENADRNSTVTTAKHVATPSAAPAATASNTGASGNADNTSNNSAGVGLKPVSLTSANQQTATTKTAATSGATQTQTALNYGLDVAHNLDATSNMKNFNSEFVISNF